jgi:PTS system nitrogen regulatory IIA component
MKNDAMNPLFSVSPQSVAIIEAADKAAILRALANVFARAYGLDAALVLERLEEREKLGSTGFGRGVAIPHARFPGVPRPVCAVMRLRRPVEFAAADGMPVELVFGLLSPENSGATHLHALAAVSRLVRDERVRDALADAPHEEALYALLIGAADRDAA